MEGQELNQLKSQLVWRKNKIQEAISGHIVPMHLVNLLKEVDSALERIDNGTYGICIICSDPIEKERLLVLKISSNGHLKFVMPVIVCHYILVILV